MSNRQKRSLFETNKQHLLRNQTLQEVERVSIGNQLQLIPILVHSQQETVLVYALDNHACCGVIITKDIHLLICVEPLSVVTIQEGTQSTLRETIKVTVPDLHEATQQFTTITQTIHLTIP